MKPVKWMLAMLGVVFMAGAVQAQFPMSGPQFRGIWNPVVGSGGVYEIDSKGGEKSEMQIAIVGSESVEGKTGYWMEMVMHPRAGEQMILKQLVVLDGDRTHVARMILQPDDQEPMEMPVQMMARHTNTNEPADIRHEAEDVGAETATTPAGMFTCEHYRMKDGSMDAWVSTKVAPWGLVKTRSKDSDMTLVKIVTDAKSKITGTPRPFNPMERMQHPPN